MNNLTAKADSEIRNPKDESPRLQIQGGKSTGSRIRFRNTTVHYRYSLLANSQSYPLSFATHTAVLVQFYHV
jgi:hypothetical protein